MTKNPFVNGSLASLYIFIIVFVMDFGNRFTDHKYTFLAPVAAISLFTLSAAVMGYLFCFQPIQLYFYGKKKQGVKLFLHTTLVFGSITILVMALLFSGLIS